MSLFDRLVSQALAARPELTAVKAVVEKELLHHDILREMSGAGLLGGADLHRRHLPARVLRIGPPERRS